TILFAKGYGHLTWNSGSAAVTVDSTLWDLASLTKVVATTPAMMLLVEQGKVALDSPVVHYLPEFNSPGTAAITVRHLLTHTSGLRATLPLREAADSAAALLMVLTTVPIAPPGKQMVYSDLTAILLGEIIRRGRRPRARGRCSVRAAMGTPAGPAPLCGSIRIVTCSCCC